MYKEDLPLPPSINPSAINKKIFIREVYKIQIKQQGESPCQPESVKTDNVQPPPVDQKSPLLIGGGGQPLGLDQLRTLHC